MISFLISHRNHVKKNKKCVQNIFFVIKGYFEKTVFEITRINCTIYMVSFSTFCSRYIYRILSEIVWLVLSNIF